ncbi:unnamed protein product [Scytosiphon promiscuus]
MATSVFNRAVADMSTQKEKSRAVVVATEAAHDLDPDRIVLSDDITAIRMHQLAITLRPLAGGSAGRPMLTASRWEIRKAIMSLCRTPPTMFEIEATDKSASIRAAFSAQAAAEDLSRKLRGVTVKIKGVKLHAFVREVSESATLCEGEDWPTSFSGPKSKVFAVPSTESGSDGEKEAAFDKLQPGKRPDTIVLRGVPANWLGSTGRAAEGADAPGLELIMGTLGPVRAVEVEPSAPSESSFDGDSASATAGGGGGGGSGGGSGSRRKGNKDGRTAAAIADFDVNALLENMPKPRALKGGGNRGGKGGANGTAAVPVVIASGGGGGSAVGVGSGGNLMSVGLHVDAWVQFASFRGFRRALEALRGKTLQKAGAELLCEYRLGVDVTGYMTEARRRERAVLRAKNAQEEERRKAAIGRARAQLVPLREGLQGLRDAAKEDGRPALEEAVEPTIQKVTGHVEKAEALLGVRVVVDEPAATAAVSHARGEIAIARLSIRKARAAVDRAEEEERQRLEREKDKELRDAAGVTLAELEETLSRALDLIAAQRQHPGIKPQADKAAALLEELSKACSKEGGSKALEAEGVESPGGGRSGGGGLVADARRATETAVTRACMLQRYLDTSARLEALRAAAGAALTGSLPDGGRGSGNGNRNGNGIDGGDAHALVQKGSTPDRQGTSGRDSNGDGGGNSGRSSAMVDDSVLTAQLDEVGAILSRELESLSEGDLLLIWESAEAALGVANGMLETLRIVNAARHRLAETKTAVSNEDPQLRSSEGIMRLMAAAVMSMARAHREGIIGKKSAVSATSSWLSSSSSSSSSHVAEQWRRAAQLADSDVAAAMREVERVSNEIRAKKQREEDEKAWRKAEEERRIREEETQRVERQARAAEREALKKRQAEARILAMELRRKEMIAQVKNKAARKRLREQFISERKASDSPTGVGKQASTRAEERAKRTELPAAAPVADRWTLEEGLGGVTSDNETGSFPPAPGATTAVPLNTDAIAAEQGAAAASSSPARGSGGEEETEAALRAGEGSSPTSAAVATGLSSAEEDRWGMDDGAADLAERGVELENGFGGEGPYLPMPSSSASPLLSGGDGGRRGRKRSRQAWGAKDQTEWLELVSKRVRSTVVGGAIAGWGAVEASNEAEDKDEEGPVTMSAAVAGDGRDTVVDDQGGANRAPHGPTSAPPTAAAAAAKAAAKGGKVEAELRLRLLAAMTEKSKARAKARGKAS